MLLNRRILNRRTRLVSLYSRRADLSCIGIPQVYIWVKSVALSPKKTVKCYGFAQTNLYFFLFCRIMTRIIVHEILSVVFLNLLYTSIHSGKTNIDFQRKKKVFKKANNWYILIWQRYVYTKYAEVWILYMTAHI